MPVRHLEGTLESALYARDLDAAEAFYGGLLGLPILGRQAGRHVFFAVGGSVLLIFDPRATSAPPVQGARFPIPPHGAEGAGHYCFRVAAGKLDDVRRDLAASCVGIEADIIWPDGAKSIYVRDPAGNSVEFAEAALWFTPD